MKITFLENGIDSLQKGFQSFLDYENRTINSEPSLDDYFVLKQAVLSTHHGVEILMKYILYMKSEFLIVDKIDSKFKYCKNRGTSLMVHISNFSKPNFH